MKSMSTLFPLTTIQGKLRFWLQNIIQHFVTFITKKKKEVFFPSPKLNVFWSKNYSSALLRKSRKRGCPLNTQQKRASCLATLCCQTSWKVPGFAFYHPRSIYLSYDTYERLSVNIDPRLAQVQNLISLIFGSSITLKGAVSHALRMLNSLKSVQPNKKSNWRESSQIKWKSVSIVANRCSFCILSIYLNYLDIRLSCYSNFLENCGNPKRYLALQAKDVGWRR